MKRLLLIVFAYICYTQLLLAQCNQDVYVYLYNGEKAKTPLSGVEVIVQNSGSTVTDKDGRCTLRFRTLKPGDKVTLRRADKPGYVLFNTEAVEQWHVSRDGSAFIIVLAKQKDMIKRREMYTRAVTKDLDRQKQLEVGVIGQKLSKGEISQPDYVKMLADLEAEYESRLEDIDNYIDRIVHADLSDMNETEKKVLDLVKNGDVLGAIKAYEEMDILGMYDQRRKEIQTLEQDIEKIEQAKDKSQEARRQLYAQAKRQNALLWMAGGEENIERGFSLLREVAMADTTESLPLLEYGKYCLRSHRLDEAKEALAYVIRNASDTASYLLANIYDCNVETMRQNYSEALPKLMEIEEFCKARQEQAGSQSLYNEERVECLALIVKSATTLRDSLKAFKYSKPLLQTARYNYESKGSNDSKRMFVEALYSSHRVLSSFGRRKQDKTDARVMIDEAIMLQEGLYHEDPVRQGAMLAFLHTTLATHYRTKMQDIEQASKEYETAERLYLEAYRKNPKAYAHYLATQNMHHALLFMSSDEMLMANLVKIKNLLDEAKKYQDLAILYNQYNNKANEAALYSMFGKYYSAIESYETALEYFNKALDIARKAFEASPAASYASYNSIIIDKIRFYQEAYDEADEEFIDTMYEYKRLKAWKEEYDRKRD